MGSSAGFLPNLSALAAVACACVLPIDGANAQAGPAQLTAAGASLQVPEAATEDDTTGIERQPLRIVPPPAVRITVGADNAEVGPVRYAVRSPVAGSAMAVSFSASPALRGIGGPSVFPTMLPIAAASLTSAFGMRYHPIHGGSRFHSGVDLAAPAGSPLKATLGGVVSTAGWSGGYGLLVTIAHGGGVETRYAHLSRLNVTAGQAIGQGDVIGYVGSTGNSTGPHVHYEVRSNGAPLDPLSR